ncbi:MAG: cadherin-like domain-containing protein, partial [Gammaproteobacteria bacterium]|nr:cadherin-like domain-containing protein [Gammaproteobacteria bacterium]
MQTSEVDVDSAQSGAFEHLLPDASFLLYGVFAQSGFDLEITNPDGIAHVVPDYFSFPTPPNLMIESGAGLSPAMVKSLFPRAFGQDVLFAGPAPSGSALVEIGSVKLVVGTVTVRHADGSQETISKGAILYQGDVLVTGAGSFIKAEMRDGTKFQLGQNGEAALDKYEFDEAADVGRFEATVRVGGFYYKSGKIGELPSASAQAHTQLNTPTSIIGVRGSELEGVVDQSGETVVVHRSGVLEITDINGENAVTLDTPGNTAVVVLNGQPAFTTEPSQQTQQALQQSLPPPDGSTAEDEAVESDAEEEVVEEAVAEAEEAVEESAEEEVVEEVVEEVAEEVEEVEEAELDESDDPEEEAEENSDEEDLDSLGVDESSVESQSDVESAEDVASNEGEGEAVETGDDEALSTFTNPDTSVDSATDDVDTTLETLQSQDSNVEGQDSGELQTLGATSSNVEESVVEVEDVAAEEPQEVIAPDNPPQALADEIAVVAGNAIDVTDQLLGNDSDPDFGQVLAIVSVNSTRPDAVTLADGRVQFQPDESLLQSLGAGESTTETFSYTLESGDSSADADVVIVYQGRNDAPIANNDVAETDEDAPLLLTVISNDSDPDLADTLVITSIDSSTALGAITIAEDGQSLLYEPSQSLSEGSIDDVFSYTISDGNTTATATVTVTVTGLNDPPVLVSDPTGFTLELIPEAGEISIPLDAIFADSDLGSTLTVLALDTELTRGSVRIGSVLYDPGDAFDYLKEGEIGIEQFGITVQDEFGQTGQGVFSFQIEGVNDAPVAVGNTSSVLENGSIDLAASSSVLGDDTDIDGDALTISSIRTGDIAATNGAQGAVGSILAGTYGVLTLNEDGQYS